MTTRVGLSRRFAAFFAAVAAGLILDVAFPAQGIWPLVFVAMSILFLALRGLRIASAILAGVLFSAAFYLVHLIWLTRYLGPVPWLALTGVETILSIPFFVGLALIYRWAPKAAPTPLRRTLLTAGLVAGLWTAREIFLGSWPYTGFPWARLGMALSDSSFAPLASWLTVSGVTFFIAFVAAAVAEVVAYAAHLRRERALGMPEDTAARNAIRKTAATVLATLLVVLILPSFPTRVVGELRVGSVQGNGPAGYFDKRAAYDVLRAQMTATTPILDKDLDLLVWPEGSVDGDPLARADLAKLLEEISTAAGAPFLVNAATTRGSNIYNSSMLWMPGGTEPEAFHDKRNPVPMGEYVPDRWFYEKIVPDLISLLKREYTPGSNAPIIAWDNVIVGLAICFDVLYDDVVWDAASRGAQFYAFQTNNADFRDTDENLQQLQFARMRAIETGRDVVNISTVGTSQVMSANGVTIDELPAAMPGAMVTTVTQRQGLTAAVAAGPALRLLFSWGSVLSLVALAYYALFLGSAAPRRS